eukprot:TRINITY_DN3989_c0_g1_i6.p2 TRINITY_DN3989_c0_g1~~TRINITY_DN3989_c0_g1_i6.p2  ORF type:complete len:121 (-),score=4.67 TRINITY_DN3989_c0_g1_i6:143-505(-)
MGKLEYTRSFGDFEYKRIKDEDTSTVFARQANKSLLISVPEVRTYQVTAQDVYLFLSTEGVFKTFRREDITDYIARMVKIEGEGDPHMILRSFARDAKEVGRLTDNVAMILVFFSLRQPT